MNEEKGRVILLGGLPRTGKTTLAVKLVKSGKKFSKISGDSLYGAIHESDLDKFEFLKTVLEKLIEDAEVYGINSIFDYCSYDFTLEDIDKLPFKDKLDMYFFGFPSISVKEIQHSIKRYAKSTDWIYHCDDDYIEQVAKRIYDFNIELKEWCNRYNYQFINTGVGEERNMLLDSLYERISNGCTV
jgi:adenylate kinase family enzyme